MISSSSSTFEIIGYGLLNGIALCVLEILFAIISSIAGFEIKGSFLPLLVILPAAITWVELAFFFRANPRKDKILFFWVSSIFSGILFVYTLSIYAPILLLVQFRALRSEEVLCQPQRVLLVTQKSERLGSSLLHS